MPSDNIAQLKQMLKAELAPEVSMLVLDKVSSPVVVVNGNVEICFVNEAAEVLFTYSRRELIGQHVNILVPDLLKEKHAGLSRDYITNPKIVMHQRMMGTEQPLYARRKDGTEFAVEINIYPFVATGHGIFVVATIKVV